MKVTILTASTGNGHLSAANALEAVCKERGITVNTHDCLKHAPWAFRTWYGGGYEFIVRTKPELYGHLYKISDERNSSFLVQTRSDYIFMARLEKILKKEDPDWVICTHSLPQPRLAMLREKLGHFRIGVVVTDLYPHLMWLRGTPDHYFVPSEWTQQILTERRAHVGDRISVTGIPVHPVFGQKYDSAETREMLGIDANLPVVTITSGGIGGGPFEEALRALISTKRPLHLEVICGRNEGRRKAIEKFVADADTGLMKIAVRGQVSQEEMARRMQLSEFLISKPGGLTTSECLACGCAMLVYEPFLIPGQEEGNADFLVSENCGAKASGPEDLATCLNSLLDNPEKLALMRKNSLGFGRPNAASDIIDAIIEMTPVKTIPLTATH